MDTMTRSGRHIRRARLAIPTVGLLLWMLAIAAPARGAGLNPPPPDFERCHPNGNGTICAGNTERNGTLEPTGIICGSGPDAFEIVDDGGLITQHAARWYDADGNLTRRLIRESWRDSAWINPAAGTSVPYVQTTATVDELAVPGDFASSTATTTGVINFVLPGHGAIVRNAGRTVFGSDGSLEFESGPQAILDYFLDGDTAALQPICAALAG